MIDRIRQGISAGIQQSASDLTIDLRSSARVTGWSRQEAATARVVASGTSLSVEAGEQAKLAEYGDASNPPRSAIRRWANRSSEIEKRIVEGIEYNLQGVL